MTIAMVVLLVDMVLFSVGKLHFEWGFTARLRNVGVDFVEHIDKRLVFDLTTATNR